MEDGVLSNIEIVVQGLLSYLELPEKFVARIKISNSTPNISLVIAHRNNRDNTLIRIHDTIDLRTKDIRLSIYTRAPGTQFGYRLRSVFKNLEDPLLIDKINDKVNELLFEYEALT